MTVYELTEEQLEELASRDEVIQEHECYDFGNDDFFCTAGRD